MATNWTKDRIIALLDQNDLAVERAVVALYDRQTQDEKRDSDTKHDNQRGFRANHAPTFSFYARIILKGWKQPNGKKRVHLNDVKLANARKVVKHYHRQLLEIAQGKEGSNQPQPSQSVPREPPVGTWAHTARELVRLGIMDGDEADRWKDEMKERDLG